MTDILGIASRLESSCYLARSFSDVCDLPLAWVTASKRCACFTWRIRTSLWFSVYRSDRTMPLACAEIWTRVFVGSRGNGKKRFRVVFAAD